MRSTPRRSSLSRAAAVFAVALLAAKPCRALELWGEPPLIWLGGDQTSAPSYGTKGVLDQTNWPSARLWSAMTTDAAGALWVYGGYGSGISTPSWNTVGALGDLWTYVPSKGKWAWVSGPPDTQSQDEGPQGQLGVPSLWSRPSARYGHSMWADKAGRIYVFGGGFTITNDLWRFDPADSKWTWLSGGPSNIRPAGVYGTRGAASTASQPGARNMAAVCSGVQSSTVWVFGGFGNGAISTLGYLNDLWTYNTDTGLWTWVAGSQIVNHPGNFEALNVPSNTTVPPARDEAVCWVDDVSGDVLIFGGKNGNGYLNDFFRFNPKTKIWTWIGGSPLAGSTGTPGIRGIADKNNIPSARYQHSGWKKGNDLILYGGVSYAGYESSVWRYRVIEGDWTLLSDGGAAFVGDFGDRGVQSSSSRLPSIFGQVSKDDGNAYVFSGNYFSSVKNGFGSALWLVDSSSATTISVTPTSTAAETSTTQTSTSATPASIVTETPKCWNNSP
ncbi:hypothetical protein HK105_206610 [Polyrhizophydium stewartii]|uniref:Galactose oxidase n=1 Tax=Polyrhizophydium stewartii TaxID=2732419 RepID=A0ABR4N326_9FUNG